ncbi:MAG TPA: fused MFS/spermidine synthase [Solirubrobacteraceae bacterium]|nr:fused MFS/spermidine synthase [Solirubrobacteraceae bacterium]
MPRSRKLIVAGDGELAVERDPQRSTGRLLRQADMDASYVDLADPRHLEFDYLRWARLVLRALGARHVLHVGGGACTLARALLAEDAGSRQEVFEVDERVLEIARAHLGLRRQPGLRVRVADGRFALETRADNSADAVMIDAFVGARVPRHMVTAEALENCARVAAATVVNVVDTAGWRDARAIAAGLGDAYPHVGALGSGARRGGNLVLFGAIEAPPLQRLESSAAADRSPARLLGAAGLAGAAPWRDQRESSSASASSERRPAAIGGTST